MQNHEQINLERKLCDFKPLNNISNQKRIPFIIGIDLTSRCNLNCPHCYINLPVNDSSAQSMELSLDEIDKISDEAIDLGTLWIMLSGGEPLLRKDFTDIYLMLKKKGFLVSVLTNATLITEEHIKLFEKYPPRALEISIYGMNDITFRNVTQKVINVNSFFRTLNTCILKGFNIILKTVAVPAVMHEVDQMKALAAQYKNIDFKTETRLISRIDQKGKPKTSDPADSDNLHELPESACTNHFGGNLFMCQAGINSCWIGSDARIYPCTSLRYKNFSCSLRTTSLEYYWKTKIPEILGTVSRDRIFNETCGSCKDRASCGWCPALSWSETGQIDRKVDSICIK